MDRKSRDHAIDPFTEQRELIFFSVLIFYVFTNVKKKKNICLSLHHWELLFSLQAKEAELLQLNKLLEESDLTASTYRQWKESNEELVQEIEKAAALKASKAGADRTVQDAPSEEVALETVATETATTESAETEGAYRLSLSDGEQLVDAEPADVLLEIPQGSPSPDGGSPVLDLSLGSLQESINRQLNEMAESGESVENYFYI